MNTVDPAAIFWRRTLLCAVVTSVILFLAEATARFVVAVGQAPSAHTLEFDAKFDLASQPCLRPLLLVVGSSIANRGVFTDLLGCQMTKAGYDYETRNLGVDGVSFPVALFMLQHTVKTAAKPTLVICSISPRDFTNRPRHYESLIKESFTGRTFDPPTDFSGKIETALAQFSYLVRHRRYLSTVLHDIVPWLFSSRPHRLLLQEPFKLSHTGWKPIGDVYSPSDFEKRFLPDLEQSWPLSRFDWTNQYINPLIGYCQKKDIPLVFVYFPEHPRLRTYFNEKEVSSKMASKIERMKQESKALIIDLHEYLNDEKYFSDYSHLNVLGAQAVTVELSQQLVNGQLNRFIHPAPPVRR